MAASVALVLFCEAPQVFPDGGFILCSLLGWIIASPASFVCERLMFALYVSNTNPWKKKKKMKPARRAGNFADQTRLAPEPSGCPAARQLLQHCSKLYNCLLRWSTALTVWGPFGSSGHRCTFKFWRCCAGKMLYVGTPLVLL